MDFIADDDEISEYEIQHSFFKVLKMELKNKGCIVKKEKERIDITVTDNKETLKYCFEVKSYIKSQERISIQSINKDINELEKFLLKKDDLEKRAFILLAIREKTLQTSKTKNRELATYLNHQSKITPLQVSKGFKHQLTSSFLVAHNTSIEKKKVGHQIRLFLLELIKK